MKKHVCIGCGKALEPEKYHGAVSGPACVPCFFAAKMKFENGFNSLDDVPEPLKTMLFQLCQKSGARWPDDVVASFLVDFERKVPVMQRWWSPGPHGSLTGEYNGKTTG
jgi:hypothetical protein